MRAVADVLQRLEEPLAVSAWTLTEFAGVLARLVRMGEVTVASARESAHLYVIDAAQSMQVIEPIQLDFERSREMLIEDPALGLLTPDALHLAIASKRGLSLYTLDRVLLHVAERLEVPASDAGVL